MMILRSREPDHGLIIHAGIQAAKMILDGRQSPAAERHLQRCTHYHRLTQTMMLYTRDAGMHSSGWWKNPDYERCRHLSLSFVGQEGDQFYPLPFDWRMAAKWAKAFFADCTRLLWIEPPSSPEGRARNVHHYRLFCDPTWQPIKPRGEVYSKDWTPAGWLSWSDVHAEIDCHA